MSVFSSLFSSLFSFLSKPDRWLSATPAATPAAPLAAPLLAAALVVGFVVYLVFSAVVGVGDMLPSAFAAAKEKSAGDGKALYKSAVGKVKQARYAAAIEDLKKALKQNDKNADFWSLYGFAARKAGSYSLAEKAYARALQINPSHLGALEYSGELYVETKRIEEARKRLESLVRLCPQGCRERTLLEQAIAGQANDAMHKW